MPWVAALCVAAGSLAAPSAACAAQSQNAEPVSKPAIAALNLRAVGGVSPEVAELLTEAVLSRLNNSGRFRSVLGRSDLEAMLDHHQQKRALGCEQEACFTELGGALGVPYLFVASLGRVGGQIVLNMKVVRVEASEVGVRATHVYPNEDVLLDRLGLAVDDLIAACFPASTVDAQKDHQLPATAPVQTGRAVAAESSASATKDPSRLYLGMGVSAVGLATVFGGYLHVVSAQRQLVSEQTVTSFNAFERAQSRSSVLAIVGWAVATTGILIWRSPK